MSSPKKIVPGPSGTAELGGQTARLSAKPRRSMVFVTSERFNEGILHLKRMHPKMGDSITWRVSDDRQQILGVIRRVYDPYILRKIGRNQYRVAYWLCSSLVDEEVGAGRTRRELLYRMFRRFLTPDMNVESKMQEAANVIGRSPTEQEI